MNTLLQKSATTIVALALILGAWVATAQSSAEAAVRQTLGWGYAAGAATAEFDGTRHHGLYNSTHADVTGSAALSEGTIQVSFTPKRSTGVQTLAHFFNSAAPDAGAVLATDGRSLVWKVGASQVTVPVELALNQPHQVHVTVAEGRLRIFLDASPVHFGDSIGFLSSVTGMNSFDIGGRNTSGQNGYADFYTGTLQRLSVLTGPLTTTQMRTVDQALNRFPVGLGDFTTLGAELAPARTGNRTWVFTGDSITHGNVHTYDVRTWSEQFAQRLVELGHASDTVVNTGISGDTSVGTSSTLGVNTRFADRVGAYEPDVTRSPKLS